MFKRKVFTVHIPIKYSNKLNISVSSGFSFYLDTQRNTQRYKNGKKVKYCPRLHQATKYANLRNIVLVLCFY